MLATIACRDKKMNTKKIPVLFSILLACVCIGPLVSAQDKDADTKTIDKLLRDITGEPVVPREANRIYIPLFENRTRRQGIAEKLRDRIREAISRDQRLAVIDSIEGIEELLR